MARNRNQRAGIGEEPQTNEFMSEREMIRDLHTRVVGTGSTDNPGLDKRLDRVENKMAVIIWVVGALMTGGFAFFWDWLKTKMGV
jgi:hypothetical protein